MEANDGADGTTDKGLCLLASTVTAAEIMQQCEFEIIQKLGSCISYTTID